MTDARPTLEASALAALRSAGIVGAVASASAPGRATLVGEHVDYADGVVVCTAIDRSLACAVARSPDGRWSVLDADGNLVAGEPGMPAPDGVTARPLAVVEALRRAGVDVPPVTVALASSLPSGAGLSSSAALGCAVAAALLRLQGARLTASRLAEVVLVAERDVVGIPCGPLDMRAVVLSPADGTLLLDCSDGSHSVLPPLGGDHVLVACGSGGSHDVGGSGYRDRRREADAARAGLGPGSFRDVAPGDPRLAGLPSPLNRRARHIVTETARALAAAQALEHGDGPALGRLMTESHLSLRDDYEVSTRALDDIVDAALNGDGCLGARMVGAGFGGTVIALVRREAAVRCAARMEAAARAHGGGPAWLLRPAPGLAATTPDVIIPA